MLKVSLVIPVYNAESILPATFASLKEFFTGKDYLREIVFVEDGSTDKTADLLEDFKNYSGLTTRILTHKKNSGKGQSVKDGILSVDEESDLVFFSDDDLPFGLEPVDKMYELFAVDRNTEVVTGDRTMVKQENPYPLHRKIGSFVYGLLMPPKIRNRFPDVHAGIRGYKREAAKKIFKKIRNSRWSFDPEIFVIAVDNNMEVKKISVQFGSHVKGTKFSFSDYFNVARELIHLRINSRMGKYKIND